MILIAHLDNCAMVLEGPTESVHLGASVFQSICRPCTCGGVRVELTLGEAHDRTTNKALIRFVDAERRGVPLPEE